MEEQLRSSYLSEGFAAFLDLVVDCISLYPIYIRRLNVSSTDQQSHSRQQEKHLHDTSLLVVGLEVKVFSRSPWNDRSARSEVSTERTSFILAHASAVIFHPSQRPSCQSAARDQMWLIFVWLMSKFTKSGVCFLWTYKEAAIPISNHLLKITRERQRLLPGWSTSHLTT